MPDPAARDPHTPIFDKNGTLWFTLQGSNMMGRLIPKTGEIKLVTPPTPRSQPVRHGRRLERHAVVRAVRRATSSRSIDPNTMAIKEYTLPNPETRPRRVAITSDDVIWYADYSRGYLGRFDPKTGKVKEWPSPGGPKSQPYGITVTEGRDLVQRVRRQAEHARPLRSEDREVPDAGSSRPAAGVVRNMMATDDGNLVLACSGVNRVALVEIK